MKNMAEKKIFQMELAERILEIHSLYGKCQEMCGEYVLSTEQHAAPDIEIDIAIKNILRENDFSQSQEYREGKEQYLYHDPGYLEYFVVHRKICEIMPFFKTFLIHGSVISFNGLGYMFTAPSGTGKTTRTKIWLKEFPGSFVVNGDKPLIRVNEDVAYAYGTPWCGKENLAKKTKVPLNAIFVLERADDTEESNLERMSKAEAYISLLKQAYEPKDIEARKITLKLIEKICTLVKIYRFRSLPSREAIRLAWKTASNDRL